MTHAAETIPLLEIKSVDIPEGKKELVLTNDEIKRLYEIKLLSTQQYFYFALLASYKKANPSVDRDWFCDEWGIKPSDFDLILAQIDKKGAIRRAKYEKYVHLSLFESSPAD